MNKFQKDTIFEEISREVLVMQISYLIFGFLKRENFTPIGRSVLYGKMWNNQDCLDIQLTYLVSTCRLIASFSEDGR